MRTIHGTLKRLLCALYYRYRTCCVVHAGRWCAPSCVDADKTWSITGALGVMAAALPARAGLRYLLTAVRQAPCHRSCGLDRVGISPRVPLHRGAVTADGGVVARATMPLFFSNSKISAVGDLGRETQGKGPTEEGKWPQKPNIPRTSKISAGNTQI